MKTILQASGVVALLAFTVLVVSLTVAVWHVDAQVGVLGNQVSLTLRGLHASANETALTMHNLREATAVWKEASKRSIDVEVQAKADLVRFENLIRHTDFQLNEQVLPQIKKTIEENSTQLIELEKTTSESVVKITANSDTLTKQASIVMTAAADNLTDPNIKATLQNVKDTSDSTAIASKEIAASLTDVRQMADKARETYLKPVNLWWSLVKQFAGFGGSIAQMAK